MAKILILDDSNFCQGLVIVQESASHQVIKAVDGAAAIDIAYC